MADHQATPEDKLRALRARLNVAPRDHQRPGGYCAINISDIRWLVNFIDAALTKEDGEDAFDAFAARAAAGHLGALVDDLRASHADLWKKAAAVALSNGFDAAYPEKLEALRAAVKQHKGQN
jgi:hypothetical protein